MNCHCAQNLLSAFIDYELDADQKRELRKHLFLCPDCQREYQQTLLLKKCLEGVYQEPTLQFDPLTTLYARLDEEKRLLPQTGQFLGSHRLILIAACFVIFFLSTFILFPSDPRPSNLAGNLKNRESFDQNFSLDQSVTVYQASLILP